MHLVEFSLLSWKKKKRLLKRISLNATSKKTVVINRVLFSSQSNQILSEGSGSP